MWCHWFVTCYCLFLTHHLRLVKTRDYKNGRGSLAEIGFADALLFPRMFLLTVCFLARRNALSTWKYFVFMFLFSIDTAMWWTFSEVPFPFTHLHIMPMVFNIQK